MWPIVGGLEGEFAGQAAFRRLDALDGGEGTAAFEYYNLRGHPALLVVAPDGAVRWSRAGLVPEADLRAALRGVLE